MNETLAAFSVRSLFDAGNQGRRGEVGELPAAHGEIGRGSLV
jgi:hypothetical protein